jgi:hypothetical protein
VIEVDRSHLDPPRFIHAVHDAPPPTIVNGRCQIREA